MEIFSVRMLHFIKFEKSLKHCLLGILIKLNFISDFEHFRDKDIKIVFLLRFY